MQFIQLNRIVKVLTEVQFLYEAVPCFIQYNMYVLDQHFYTTMKLQKIAIN